MQSEGITTKATSFGLSGCFKHSILDNYLKNEVENFLNGDPEARAAAGSSTEVTKTTSPAIIREVDLS